MSVGHTIKCSGCNGFGLRTVWSFGVKEAEECPHCNGTGANWLYPSGALAQYEGGPLMGRLSQRELVKECMK